MSWERRSSRRMIARLWSNKKIRNWLEDSSLAEKFKKRSRASENLTAALPAILSKSSKTCSIFSMITSRSTMTTRWCSEAILSNYSVSSMTWQRLTLSQINKKSPSWNNSKKNFCVSAKNSKSKIKWMKKGVMNKRSKRLPQSTQIRAEKLTHTGNYSMIWSYKRKL